MANKSKLVPQESRSVFDSLYESETLALRSRSPSKRTQTNDESATNGETHSSNPVKQKPIPNTKREHIKVPSRSITDLPPLDMSVTPGGYGSYNAYDDQYELEEMAHMMIPEEDNESECNQQYEYESKTSSESSKPEPNEYMKLNTTDDHDLEEKQKPSKDTLIVPIISNGKRISSTEDLDEQIRLATSDHIRIHSKYYQKEQSKCFRISHWCGLLHYCNIIYRSMHCTNATQREDYINILMKEISFKDVVKFELLRTYVQMYCTTDYEITETILECIEEYHGESVDEEQKRITLQKYWNDLVFKECTKHFYILPLLFGWTEMFAILNIKYILIMIIFYKSDDYDVYTNDVYILSLLLVIVVVLHMCGVIYQYLVCNRTILLSILRESKSEFVGNSTLHSHLNERYIPTQKWMNSLMVTAHPNFGRRFAWFFMRKYVVLLVIAICIFVAIFQNIDLGYVNVEWIYIVFQLGIMPLWMILGVFGLKDCARFMTKRWKYACALFVFFVLFVSQCIHYYEYVMYMENVQFIENYIPMVYTTLIINMFLVFFAVKYGYKEHCAYYFICLLMVYLCVTLRILVDPDIFPLDSNNLLFSQFIFKIIIYSFISISNFLYFYIVEMKYLETNGVKIDKFCTRFFYSLCSIFLCNYQCHRYEMNWL